MTRHMGGESQREAGPQPPSQTQGYGLVALCALARFHQVAADPQTLGHQLGLSANQGVKPADLLLAARHLGLKAKWVQLTPERLRLAPLPALAWLGGEAGHAVLLAQSDGLKVLVQDFEVPLEAGATPSRPQVMDMAALQQQGWSGQLMLVSSRASLMGALAKFDFTWFIPALV